MEMDWTHEEVYREPIEDPRKRAFKQGMPPHVPSRIRDEIKAGKPHPYTNAYIDALFAETVWEPYGEDPLFQYKDDPSFLLRVGAEEEVCPACSGRRERRVKLRGALSGVPSSRYERCRCTFYKDRHRYVSNEMMVPERYKHASLRGLKPSLLSNLAEIQQAGIIKQLQSEPKRSYFFYGGAGTGKTYLATALYIAAVNSWALDCYQRDIPSLNCTFRLRTGAFLDSCVAYASRGDKEVAAPRLSAYNILALARRGYRVSLFLEEIDKFYATEFKLIELAAIVDAVYSTHGQLVTTSNTSVDDLFAKWNSHHAHAILRRFVEEDGMAICFEGKMAYRSHEATENGLVAREVNYSAAHSEPLGRRFCGASSGVSESGRKLSSSPAHKPAKCTDETNQRPSMRSRGLAD